MSRKFALGHKGISPFTQWKMLLRFLLLALFILDLTNNYDLLLEFFITISVSAVPQTLVKSTSVAYIVHRIPLHENSPQGKPYHSSTRNKKYYCIVLIVEQYDCVAVANNTDIQEYVQSLKKLTCQSYNRQKKVSMPQGRKVLVRYVKELFFSDILYISKNSKSYVSRKSWSYTSAVCWNRKFFNPNLKTLKKQKKLVTSSGPSSANPQLFPKFASGLSAALLSESGSGT